MASPSTTHVIEIESGIGEPAFIPLTLGRELQPISLGKKGMWRVDGARVMDVHAFVYFDGASLFLQSADESDAAVVDGYRIGKAWTELHAPCTIEVGGARLSFRSLLPSADGQAALHSARQPRSDRPFKPGEFSRGGQTGESTRPEAARLPGPMHHGMPPMQPMMGAPTQGPSPSMSPAQRAPYLQSAYPSLGCDAGASGPYAPAPPPHGSLLAGGYGSVTPGQPAASEPRRTSRLVAHYKSRSVLGRILVGLLPLAAVLAVSSRWDDGARAPRPPRAGSADASIAPSANTATGAQPTAPPTAPGAASTSLPAWPPSVACPPQGWPPDVPLPCAPNDVKPAHEQATVDAPKDAGAREPKASPEKEPRGSGAGLPAGVKTFERQAVDAVAAGDYARAAAVYEELSRREPASRVYAEAARILRSRLDGGAN